MNPREHLWSTIYASTYETVLAVHVRTTGMMNEATLIAENAAANAANAALERMMRVFDDAAWCGLGTDTCSLFEGETLLGSVQRKHGKWYIFDALGHGTPYEYASRNAAMAHLEKLYDGRPRS